MTDDVSFSKDFKNPVKLLQLFRIKKEEYFLKRGEKNALKLFGQMAQRVPGYRDFLKKNKIDYKKVKTIADFKKIPTIDKDNYLRKYALRDLCWDGRLREKRWVFATTSGSTGEPFYFPRQDNQDSQYAVLAELFLRSNFQIEAKSTLFIVGFPMGAWIGGLFTYTALKILAARGGYNLSIFTPGIVKAEILKAVKKLGPNFDQVIIGSYGPFLKDIVDDAESYGVNWKDYKLGFIFAAEGFSESFRDYILKKTGTGDSLRSTLNIYGTVDLGTMAHETPLSILVRRLALSQNKVYQNLFGDITKLPTLTQYIPELFYFEAEGGNLVCSCYSGIPLARYDLKDHGDVLTFDEVRDRTRAGGVDLGREISKVGIGDSVWNLPFVHVYERSDFSVSFFAFQIYPETIRRALSKSELEGKITGKFTMMVKFDKNSNQYLEINVELRPDIKGDEVLEDLVRESVTERLLEENSEYCKTSEEFPDRTIPKIVFWPYEDPTCFKAGSKQKWVKKS